MLAMITTRKRLLEYLSLKEVATAKDISRHLQLTAANVRYHLSALVFENIVEEVGISGSSARGRPSKLYRIASHRDRLSFMVLTKALLSIIEGQAEDQQAKIIEQIAEQILAINPPLPQRGSLSSRMNTVVQLLNRMNYDAHWEAHAQAPRLIMKHCPYERIITDHPILCNIDAQIVQKLINLPAFQSMKRQPSSQESNRCIFLIGQK